MMIKIRVLLCVLLSTWFKTLPNRK